MGNVTEFRVALTVGDFDRAVAFYRDALGLEQIADWSSAAGRVVVLEAGRGLWVRGQLVAKQVHQQAVVVAAVAAGARLFGDGPAGSSWFLAEARPTSSGALCLRYDLIRPAAGR